MGNLAELQFKRSNSNLGITPRRKIPYGNVIWIVNILLIIIGFIDAIWTFTTENKPQSWEMTTAALSIVIPTLISIFVWKMEHSQSCSISCAS